MTPTVVITGSTRGIGFGLAQDFLARDCQVVVSGRSQPAVDAALETLSDGFPAARKLGIPCEVTAFRDLQNLWDRSLAHFGRIDFWINNAGIGQPVKPLWELPLELIDQIIQVNMLGLIYGTQVAVQGMLDQGGGMVYNMEGMGSGGQARPGFSVYGATKSGVRTFTKTVIQETKDTPVKVGTLSPGMVVTDFVTDQYQDDPDGLEKIKPIFNILADKPETVTPWLVDRILNESKHGAHFAWLTRPKVVRRFATAGFKRRDLFGD